MGAHLDVEETPMTSVVQDGQKRSLPKAILFDMDGTILDSHDGLGDLWRRICGRFTPHLNGLSTDILWMAIAESRTWFWSEPERARLGRMNLQGARRAIVWEAFDRLGVSAPDVAREIADGFSVVCDDEIKPFPGAVEVLKSLRERALRMGLVTNGAAEPQRAKVDRFKLGPLFDCVLIEGEFGVGKPDERIYLHALERLEVETSEAWMVGDNLEWEVAAPQRLGIQGVWVDSAGAGLPPSSDVRPDRIISSLSGLL